MNISAQGIFSLCICVCVCVRGGGGELSISDWLHCTLCKVGGWRVNSCSDIQQLMCVSEIEIHIIIKKSFHTGNISKKQCLKGYHCHLLPGWRVQLCSGACLYTPFGIQNQGSTCHDWLENRGSSEGTPTLPSKVHSHYFVAPDVTSSPWCKGASSGRVQWSLVSFPGNLVSFVIPQVPKCIYSKPMRRVVDPLTAWSKTIFSDYRGLDVAYGIAWVVWRQT